MVGVNEIFTSLKWFVLITAVGVSLLFLYYPTSEAQAEAFSYNGVSLIAAPEIDTPFILTVIWLIWFMLIVSQTSWKALKVASGRVIMDGIKKPNSCICSELHRKSDLGFIRVGGSKLLPGIQGTTVYIAPLTHITKPIGDAIWIEAHGAPDLGLDNVPPDVIEDIYQQRRGLFGITTCSLGFLSSNEMQTHTVFNGKNFIDADEGDKKQWTTTTFISYVMALNKDVAGLYNLFCNDTTSIEAQLASIKKIGRAAGSQETKGILDHFLVTE